MATSELLMTTTNILVTNDDGGASEGLFVLANALEALAEVWVVAPDRDRSGSSHALTMTTPLRWRPLDRGPKERSVCVDGTPSDCVYFGLSHLLRDHQPRLVVAGINRGYNLADDVTYSGTVAAAIEATLLGVPAIAVSVEEFGDAELAVAGEVATFLARHVLTDPSLLPPGTFLNVNMPSGAKASDLVITTLGRRAYSKQVNLGVDPRKKTYFWIGGDPMAHESVPGTDCVEVLDRKRISVTPMHVDMTCRDMIDRWAVRIQPPTG
jgi:5'-nucleotidase